MIASGRTITVIVVGLVTFVTAFGVAAPPTSGDSGAPQPAGEARSEATGRVLAISVDGLNPVALRRLGRRGAPALHRLLRAGAATTNARTQVESTATLPNHTSMVTGRRVAAAKGGHGVTWNSDLTDRTVQSACGEPDAASVFSEVARAGGRSAVFATKAKFGLFARSWPDAVDREVIRVERDGAVTRALIRDLPRARAFTFWHLGVVDRAGHRRGWLSKPYLRAVRRADRLIGSVLRAARRDGADDLRVVLTADHGGHRGARRHGRIRDRASYRVPFIVWGPGVDALRLYPSNTAHRRDPRRGRPRFAGTHPVRNGELANVALDLLGLGPVPRSRWNADQDLTWTG